MYKLRSVLCSKVFLKDIFLPHRKVVAAVTAFSLCQFFASENGDDGTAKFRECVRDLNNLESALRARAKLKSTKVRCDKFKWVRLKPSRVRHLAVTAWQPDLPCGMTVRWYLGKATSLWLSWTSTITRKLTNVGTRGTYAVRIKNPAGISVNVVPKVLTFSKKGDVQKFEMTGENSWQECYRYEYDEQYKERTCLYILSSHEKVLIKM
ncbi:subtilisin-like protease SBT5.4 [Tanacetum coccineum]